MIDDCLGNQIALLLVLLLQTKTEGGKRHEVPLPKAGGRSLEGVYLLPPVTFVMCVCVCVIAFLLIRGLADAEAEAAE
jgi:hypothetical protein